MTPRPMGQFMVRVADAFQLQKPHVVAPEPVQIVAGRRDPVVPPGNAEYLLDCLPDSEQHLVDATHFIWEDAAEEYTTLVSAWWAGGFKTCMKTSKGSLVRD